jgi:flagellar hook-basal body complex protein FliE
MTPISGVSGISGISGISSVGGNRGTERVTPSDGTFADRVGNALQSVSNTEKSADLMAQDVAAGGDTPIHELMIATTKATLSVDMLVQMRNRAVEAYQEVMRMQV